MEENSLIQPSGYVLNQPKEIAQSLRTEVVLSFQDNSWLMTISDLLHKFQINCLLKFEIKILLDNLGSCEIKLNKICFLSFTFNLKISPGEYTVI